MGFDEASQGDDIETGTRTFPRPPVHSAQASFVISDDLYEIVSQRFPDCADDVVLAESFSADFLPGDDYCVLLSTSPFAAGTEKNGQYVPYTEYSLKIRRVRDTGEPEQKTPRIALNVTIAPQYPESVTTNGNEFNCPYGEGTLLRIQTTNVTDTEGFVNRTRELLDSIVGYDLSRFSIKPASTRVSDLEVTHRFIRDELGSVVETLRDTEDLITYANGPSEAYRSHDSRGWIEAELYSQRFDLLGFLGSESARLKVYTPRNRSASGVVHHPRIEARLGKGETLHFDRFDEVVHRLRAIVCSHLLWANVTTEDLVTAGDPLYDSAIGELEWDHPDGRHEQLRERHASVATEVKQEALKPTTMALYDILITLIEYPGCTYQDLMDKVGLTYSSIQRHVSRLVDRGILARHTGAVSFITFASKEVRKHARRALNQIYPEQTADDRAERREERRSKREQDTAENENLSTTGADDGTVSAEEMDLSTDELVDYLRSGNLSSSDVILRNPPPGGDQDD
jgi:DNA-binding MarR family transcriptional regulator